MSLVHEIRDIRSRSHYSANDVTVWVIKVFQDLYGLEGLEKVATEVQIHGGGIRGRADIVVEDAIGIETKSDLDREEAEAERQVGNILVKLERDGAAAPVGIATDGMRWQFYIHTAGQVQEFHRFTIDSETDDARLEDELWTGLYALQRTTDLRRPTAAAVSEVFRPGGPAFREIQAVLRASALQLVQDDPSEFASKFLTWHEVFRYVYNKFDARCVKSQTDDPNLRGVAQIIQTYPNAGSLDLALIEGGLELFLRHTYLAVLAKLLGALVAVGKDAVRTAVRDSPKDLVNGELVRTSGVLLTEENDFFSWVGRTTDSAKLAQTVYLPLSRFSDDYTDDVFRHLYEEVVDAETRHNLGEFFTPRWMAELIVSRTISHGGERVIDPACGSGTFLVAALERKARLKKARDPTTLGKILDEIWGIDINPLSVVLARTNLYLAYARQMQGQRQPPLVTLRIYTSDSFILPRYDETRRRLTGGTSPIVQLEITPRISVPVLPGLEPSQALKIIDEMAEMVSTAADLDRVELNDATTELDLYRLALLDALRALRHEFGDSLWKYVLRNFGVPPLVVGTFDAVVGNPPWLTYREASGGLQARMKEAFTQRDIRPDQATRTSFNLATAFIIAAQPLLRKDSGAKLGFVMPFSLLNSRAHRPFMDSVIDGRSGLKYREAYDARQVMPAPFEHNLDSCIIILEAT